MYRAGRARALAGAGTRSPIASSDVLVLRCTRWRLDESYIVLPCCSPAPAHQGAGTGPRAGRCPVIDTPVSGGITWPGRPRCRSWSRRPAGARRWPWHFLRREAPTDIG